VLDWEFRDERVSADRRGAICGGFRSDYPLAFNDAFATGLADDELAGADALDLFALADLLTRPPESALFDRVVRAVRERGYGSGDERAMGRAGRRRAGPPGIASWTSRSA